MDDETTLATEQQLVEDAGWELTDLGAAYCAGVDAALSDEA